MSESTTERPARDRAPGDRAPGDQIAALAAHYSPDQERPLRAYATLASVYGGALAGAWTLIHGRGESSRQPSAADVLLIGIATHKLSRLIAKDKITSFVRAPFTRFQAPGGPGEVEEEPCGHGLRLAVGELLVCPYCLAQWVATGLTTGLVVAPRPTRLFSTILVAHTISDFLQVADRVAVDQA